MPERERQVGVIVRFIYGGAEPEMFYATPQQRVLVADHGAGALDAKHDLAFGDTLKLNQWHNDRTLTLLLPGMDEDDPGAVAILFNVSDTKAQTYADRTLSFRPWPGIHL